MPPILRSRFDSVRMNRENLATYLNDHLAGSVAALELLDHLVDSGGSAHEQFFRDLRTEIAADQDVLRSLLEDLCAPESTVRKVGAWLMEKAARAKLRFEGSAGSAMHRLEALEALLLGITGKRALWLALAASQPPLDDIDLPALVRRADQQIRAVEARRIEAALEAINSAPVPS